MTQEPRLVEVRKNILKQNDVVARELRGEFRRSNVFVVSLVSSPGSGKTTFLEQLQQYFNSIDLNSSIILESPIKSYLNLFYSDMRKYEFSFQMDMLRQRQRCNENSLALAQRGHIVWNDRSMIGDPVFRYFVVKII